MSDNFSRGTGGIDAETNELFDAHFECFDCGLYYSWPVTPGIAPNEDPLQTEMLVLVNGHTSAVCRVAQVKAALQQGTELTKALAGEFATSEGQVRERQAYAAQTVQELVEHAATKGYSTPISGDPVVTLQQAIDRGTVTCTKGLPGIVEWRRKNPELAKTHHYVEFKTHNLGMWPQPSHDARVALAGTDRRTVFAGWLQHGPDMVAAS